MSARKKRKQRLGHTCASCRFFNTYNGRGMCYYDFQDECPTDEGSWCINYLPKEYSPISRLIPGTKGMCCEACGYTPKEPNATCPLCGRIWKEVQNEQTV